MSSSSSKVDVDECEDCPICCEKYSKKRMKITCSSCEYSSCVSCIKQYLLGSADEPHCMNCRKGWEMDVQYNILGKSFVNGDMRKHRKHMLYEREKSQFPTTQSYIDTKMEIDEYEKKVYEVNKEIRKLKRVRENLMNHKYSLERKLNGKGKEKENKIENLLKCPKDGCRGYINKNECKLCCNHICRKCMVLVENEELLKEHVCDEEMQKTAQLILKSSKPCPTCGTRISKVSGCDQMWCPECEVAFSWTTGMKVNGVIHNPHFYEYRRRRGDNFGNRTINRNAGDVVCGGLVRYNDLDRLLGNIEKSLKKNISKSDKKYIRDINECYRTTAHFQNVTVAWLRRELQEETNNVKERAEFMMGKITEEQFIRTIIRKDNKREKKQSLLHIYETLVTMFVERINYFVAENTNNYEKFIDSYNDLVVSKDYIQEQLVRVSRNYNVVVEGFWKKDSFEISRRKA